jgi:hypothetical protein
VKIFGHELAGATAVTLASTRRRIGAAGDLTAR